MRSGSYLLISVKIPRYISNVELVTPVTGRFDLVIKLRTNDPTKAFNTVEKIRAILSINFTQTANLLPKNLQQPQEQGRGF